MRLREFNVLMGGKRDTDACGLAKSNRSFTPRRVEVTFVSVCEFVVVCLDHHFYCLRHNFGHSVLLLHGRLCIKIDFFDLASTCLLFKCCVKVC